MGYNEFVQPEKIGSVIAEATSDPRWLDFDATLIAGGKSNLTFELSSPAGSLILRRPPAGNLLPSAHDMVREVRVQRALAPSPVPVPEVLFLDSTGEILGVPFYVMNKVEGHVIRGKLPLGYAESASAREAMAGALVDVLGALHVIDPHEIGLLDFGKPEGFLARQIQRWSDQWERTKTSDVRAVSELALRLSRRVPLAQRNSIVHGDFRIDNCVYSETSHEIEAVLDWELSTLGDPLVDLGMTRFYWRDPSEREIALVPSVTGSANFPSRDFLAEHYAATTGLDLGDLPFYDAFARFKFAIITQGVLVRSSRGDMAGQTFEVLEDEVGAIAAEGLDIICKEGR